MWREMVPTSTSRAVSTDTEASGRPLPSFRARIVESRRVRAGELVPHPGKYRVHIGGQRAFLRADLEEIGHAYTLIAMRLPDHKGCQGHPRLLMSQRLGWKGVPTIRIVCPTNIIPPRSR
jgi:hypothetical protein